MKIIVIGGNGTIGKVVVAELLLRGHEVLVAGRSEDPYKINIADNNSIKALLQSTGTVDAIACIAGEAKWAPMDELSEEDYYIGIRSKLMGQVNLVRIGQHYLNDNGSITLSTGILADDPVRQTASAAMVNGAIHSFVQAASLELNGKYRLNAVSLGLVQDAAEKYRDYFPGHTPISMQKATDAYIRAIMGDRNGEVIRIYN